MESKIEEQERERDAFEQTIVSLTTQLKAKEAELSEQVEAKEEELRHMKRELDATEAGRVRVQRELNHANEATALLSTSASV